MESLLAAAQDDHTVLSVDILDVSAGGATLYILNGGAQPPMPIVGDFLYDLRNSTFSVYHPNGWHNTTKDEVRSQAWHPNGNRGIISFTTTALPFWMPSNEDEYEGIRASNFGTVKGLLERFRATFDAKDIKVSRIKVSASPATRSKPTVPQFCILVDHCGAERNIGEVGGEAGGHGRQSKHEPYYYHGLES